MFTSLFAIGAGLWSIKFAGALLAGAAALLTIVASTYKALPDWLRRVLIYAGVLAVVAGSGFYTGYGVRDDSAAVELKRIEITAYNTGYAARKEAEKAFPSKLKPSTKAPPKTIGFLEGLFNAFSREEYVIPKSVCAPWRRIDDADSAQVRQHNFVGAKLVCW